MNENIYLSGEEIDVVGMQKILHRTIEKYNLDESVSLVNLAMISHQVDIWRSTVSLVEPVYSLSLNPDIEIVQELLKKNLNFSISSDSEVDVLSKLKTNVNLIDKCKNRSDTHIRKLQRACDSNLAKIVYIVSSIIDMDQIVKCTKGDEKFVIYIAFNFGSANDDEYGCNVDSIVDLLLHAKSKGLFVQGISMPVHEYNVVDYYTHMMLVLDCLKGAMRAFDIYQDNDILLETVHLSGFYVDGLVYHREDADKMLFALNTSMDNFLANRKYSKIKFITDSCESLIIESGILAVSVQGVKFEGEEAMYYVNDGVYGSFHLCMVGPFVGNKLNPFIFEVNEAEKVYSSTLWGPTCDSLDCIGRGLYLPKLKVGDWMFFKNTGAFSSSSSTNFNGCENPRKVYYSINNNK